MTTLAPTSTAPAAPATPAAPPSAAFGPLPTLAAIRAHFPGLGGPGLSTPNALLDNAGGSQVPRAVIDAVADYFATSFVQTGAEYTQSRRATATLKAAHDAVKTFLNAHGRGEVVLGPSTTALTHLLANAYGDLAASDTPPPADRREIIVSTAGHEANVWPWMRLAARGYTIRAWDIALDSAGRPVPDMAALDALLSSRTLLVAFPHVSNILGDVWDARAICAKARAAGASTVVDGVALAPHRLPDVADIGCDFYVYSTYKVFGPHAAALFGTADAFAPLTGPNHPFIPKSALPGKFELGGFNHESAAAIVATHTYFRFLAGLPESELQPSTPADRATLARAFAHAESLERATAAPLLSALTSSKAVRLWGRPAMDEHRVCTISFTFQGKRSADVARELNAQGLGVKHGHFYSRRLLESLGLDPEDGVVRVSLAHYNTPDEVQRLLAALAPHLG